MTNGVFIYEFLFRGGAESKPDDDTWHVTLARPSVGIDGKERLELLEALTPQRAAELGFSLESILTYLNNRAVAEVVGLREHVRTVEAQRDEALEAVGKLEIELARSNRKTAVKADPAG